MAALDITVTLFAYLTLLTKDFQGMSEIFSNFQGLSKTFKDFKDFQRLQVPSRSLRNFRDFQGLLRNFRDFQGLLRTLRDFQVLTGTSKRLSRISKDPQEPSGTPQDLKDFKIPSKTSGTIPLLVTSIHAVLRDL